MMTPGPYFNAPMPRFPTMNYFNTPACNQFDQFYATPDGYKPRKLSMNNVPEYSFYTLSCLNNNN
jgi:hypothetical protein